MSSPKQYVSGARLRGADRGSGEGGEWGGVVIHLPKSVERLEEGVWLQRTWTVCVSGPKGTAP